jgi:exonuclease VII large subunit
MTELLDQIQALLAQPARDLDRIERTLTDGYAQALTLEAERARLERRVMEAVQGIEGGDAAKKARELAALSRRLEGNQDDLSALRAVLGKLRRHAEVARVGTPTR